MMTTKRAKFKKYVLGDEEKLQARKPQTKKPPPKEKTKQSWPTEAKLGRMQTFLNMMTPAEKEKFRDSTLNSKEKLQTRKSTTLLSRETSPHTNRAFTGVLPSRETGPHISQVLRQLAKIPERCEECGGEHPTHVCIKRFKRLRRPEPPTPKSPQPKMTTLDTSNDDLTGSDTLYDSEESKEDTPATSPTRLTKTVTFDLPRDTPSDEFTTTTQELSKPEAEDPMDKLTNDVDNCQTQTATFQNDEANERLVHAARLRKTSDNMYMSNRKSMNLRTYIHTMHQRTETAALLDSGATENFMNLTYTKWLKLPFKCLTQERPLYNVDGSTNKSGSIKYYVDLEMQTGTKRTNMRFFLTDMGDHKVILGYLWFAANQPKIDWAQGWIDTTQLPLIIRSTNVLKAQFNPSTRNLPDLTEEEILYIRRIHIEPRIARQTMSSTLAEENDKPHLDPIPTEYRRHHKVFSEEATQRFPELRIWDHAIELKPGAPSTLPGKIYTLSQLELQELAKFIKEHLAKGYI